MYATHPADFDAVTIDSSDQRWFDQRWFGHDEIQYRAIAQSGGVGEFGWTQNKPFDDWDIARLLSYGLKQRRTENAFPAIRRRA